MVINLCRKMGFISRKIFPACGNMCVCCPAMRSRSRQPVKRYKKLLAEIFPKSPVSINVWFLSILILHCSEKPRIYSCFKFLLSVCKYVSH